MSLNPYSTGNEVVGLPVLDLKLEDLCVLILILLEMRLLVILLWIFCWALFFGLNPYSTGNEVVGKTV